MIFKGTVKIQQEEEWFVAICLENNIASQGKTVEQAMANLKEAIALYYEDDAKREELNYFRDDPVYVARLEMAI